MVRRTTISGSFHGITTDTPPTVDPQGFEDVVNFIGYKGRLRTRPGLAFASGFSSPDYSPILNMCSFIDVADVLHTLALTQNNPYMLTAGPVLNQLTYPTYINKVTLVNPGLGYSVGDILNIEQAGAANGQAEVIAVGTGAITAITGIQVAGTGYKVGDVLQINQSGAQLGTCTVTSISGGGASGPITGVTLTTAGYGYTSSLGVELSGGSGTGAYIFITVGGLVQSLNSVYAPGTGYVIGDVVNLTQYGSATGCTVKLTSTTPLAGVIITPGSGYTTGTAQVTGGSGVGAGFNITASGTTTGVITQLSLYSPGQGYSTASPLPTNGGEGTGATVGIVATTLTSLGGPNATNLPYALVRAQNKVYFCNGSAPLCYTDGEATFKVAGNVPGACRFLTVNAGHLIGAYWTEPDPTQSGAVIYPQRVRGSDSSNFNQWDTAGLESDAFVADITDAPDNITGLSTLGTNTYIYRSNGISIATPTGNASEPFYIRNYSLSPKGEGCFYPYSLTTYNNIDRFIGNYDVWAFDGSNFTPLMDGKCNAEFFNDLKSVSGTSQVRGMITVVLDNGFPFLGYVISLPGTNTAWVLNITEGSWTRFNWPTPPQGAGYYDLQFIEQVYLS